MPNFEAKIRRDYRDINGLVLDLSGTGIVADATSGLVDKWVNSAPSVIASDPTDPRYLNAVQTDVSLQGLLGSAGGIPHVIFDNAFFQHMTIDMVGDFGSQKEDYTFAFELGSLGGDLAVNQAVFGADEVDLFAVGTPNTTRGYRLDATTAFDAGIGAANRITVYQLETGAMNRFENGVAAGGGASSPITLGDSTINPVATLAGDNSGAGFFDGNIRNMRVWNRQLQDTEIDFAFQTLGSDPADDFSTSGLATIVTKVWNDDTSVPPRVNPNIRAAHLFLLATIPIAGTGNIHLEATIDGVVVPDSGLGGNLFSVTALETPDGVPPLAGPLATGFSALQFVRLEAVGHYTLEFRRIAGGAIIFHIDVEEV